jgi:simple sugar transport system substrate-binding protein
MAINRVLRLTAALVTTAVLAVACGSNTASPSAAASAAGGSGAAPAGCPYKFAVITHGDTGSFWSVVYKGAKDAAAATGCTLSTVYGSQQQGQAQPDDNAENQAIQDAINQKVDGLAVSDHNPSLMNPTLANAVKAGIPVVLINAGCDDATIAASGAMTCVGQPEAFAGKQAGARFMAEQANNVLCVIHQSGQNLLDRCNGIAQALGTGSTCATGNAPATGPACTELTLSTPNAASNPSGSAAEVTGYLQAHPGITAVMTLNNAIAQGVQAALGSGSKVKLATFDLNEWDIAAVKAGTIDFIVDQQQYLQGYLPIVFLQLYKAHYGASVGGGTTVPTGPLLVDKTNVSNVEAGAKAGES